MNQDLYKRRIDTVLNEATHTLAAPPPPAAPSAAAPATAPPAGPAPDLDISQFT